MKYTTCFWMLVASASALLTGCKHDDVSEHHYDNKLYITTAPVTDDLLIKADVVESTRTISTRLAAPADHDVTITFEAKPREAAIFNQIYGDTAFALDEEYWEIPVTTATIAAGDIAAEDIAINFRNTNQLDSKYRYVLPVTISSVDGMEVLESRRTVYFLFRGAALINVVADIRENYFPVNWSAAARPLVSNLKTITIEALVRSDDWSAKRENPLSTLFGIEGSFLIRIGDSDRPRDQLQLVAPGGNWPNPNAAPGLPVNEWVHIAVVWDATTGERYYYQNGNVVASSLSGASGSVSLANSCYVGKSYDNSRWLPGEISELRIWNVQRTAEQIKANPYWVDPATPGLIAYWKFNEGQGSVIKDATANGTDLTGVSAPTWVPVELPKID